MDADFEIVAPQPVVPSPPSPDEISRGDYWSLLECEGRYVLEYISGEMFGRLRQLVVTEEEAQQLKRGDVEAEQVIIAHGES
ncbi:hypothetical protein EON80_17770 [bacterium]|nr:MAG: hypothetical protein EON80_17770 [bacterium]